jgi:multicomponent Na+:H+ antiporter subunit G
MNGFMNGFLMHQFVMGEFVWGSFSESLSEKFSGGFSGSFIDLLSYGCIITGVIFWFWGTFPLLGDRSVLFKLHTLSVSDTLGSMAIMAGLLLKIPQEWPLLLLAIIATAIWNTVLGYVIAYCSSRGGADERI